MDKAQDDREDAQDQKEMHEAHKKLQDELDAADIEAGVFKPPTPVVTPYIPRPIRHLPAVLHSFPTLRRGRQQLRVRIIQYPKSEKLLDVREFITGEQFNGFSPKGIAINLEQAVSLFENSELILRALRGED